MIEIKKKKKKKKVVNVRFIKWQFFTRIIADSEDKNASRNNG